MEPSLVTPEQPSRHGPALAKPLAPEDVREGDHVVLLDVTVQCPAILLCCESEWGDARTEMLRFRYLPTSDRQTPLKVLAACLPLVLVETPAGDGQTLDLRQVRIARLSKRYAQKARKALGSKRKKKKSRS